VFTVRGVYVEMMGGGTRYAESTVFKTMQRMKDDPKMKDGPKRPPTVRLESSGTEGFRIAEGAGAPECPTHPAYWGGLLPGPPPLLACYWLAQGSRSNEGMTGGRCEFAPEGAGTSW
jgi:hypothetical protein